MPSYLLSFELDKKQDSLLIRADEMGLRRLSEMLLHVLDNTKEGHFHEESLSVPEQSKQNKGGKTVSNLRICCWRGEKPQKSSKN